MIDHVVARATALKSDFLLWRDSNRTGVALPGMCRDGHREEQFQPIVVDNRTGRWNVSGTLEYIHSRAFSVPSFCNVPRSTMLPCNSVAVSAPQEVPVPQKSK